MTENINTIVGALIVGNIATIISVIAAAGRVVWYLAKLDSKVKEHDKDINAAHEKIREVKSDVKDMIETLR